MSLKNVFSALKTPKSYVIKELDLYLLSLNSEENDRAIDVNAPSQIGGCMRARYYTRTGEKRDANSINARTRRIFDNGHKVHDRLQSYLEEQGMLLMPEVPIHNDLYNIQGHTDGILNLGEELGVLEIKSINSNGYSRLKDAKEEHKMQGLIYLYCLEEKRKYLRETYPTLEEFQASEKDRIKKYISLYPHLKGGKKYSRKQKLALQLFLHLQCDEILWETGKPISKVVFLYENKDTQDLKEFVINSDSEESKELIKEMLEECNTLNEMVKEKLLPDRPFSNKSDCRWCDYKNKCWVV